VPPLVPGQPPLAILVDYDGTIAQTDVSDVILADFVSADWEARVAEYDAGLVGARGLMEWEVGLITAEPAALMATAAAQPHDPGFRAFAERARDAGIPMEVVSDGFGFFIEPALRSLGLDWVPVATASTTFPASGPQIAFPYGNPDCFACGTCKRNRVRAHQAAGRAVVFIGDGESDRYAAGYSDIVFAKHALERICRDYGWPFRRWTEFSEIDAWLADVLARFAADSSSLPGPTPRPPFCGAEVWGPGRRDPLPINPVREPLEG
jgi:2,3-diketo-5-methylthio-1-phosphopentane phosphatase